MITKEQYIRSVNAISGFQENETELFNMTNGHINIREMDWVQDLIQSYVDLLEELTNPKTDNEDNVGWLPTFLYDTNCGKHSVLKDGSSIILNNNGDSVYMRNVDELYENFIKPNTTVADHIRGMNDEELSEYLYSFYKTGRLMESVNLKEEKEEDILEFIKRPQYGEMELNKHFFCRN